MPKGFLTINVVDYDNYLVKESTAIASAKISISYMSNDESKKPTLLPSNIKTDEFGQIKNIVLYTPDISSSEVSPNKRPYSRYIVEVTKEGYQTVIIKGVQVFSSIESIQTIKMKKLRKKNYRQVSAEIYEIGDIVVFGDYPPKDPEDELKIKLDPDVFYVMTMVTIPEFIIVHDGVPTYKDAIDYWVPFKDYIKNVACSEIYPDWNEQAIYANVIAIISFTLNRFYTEWYRNQKYPFIITSSTQYDHKFIPNRNTFDTINKVVDDIFNMYIRRPSSIEPLAAQYCDGKKTHCPGRLEQFGSQELALKGHSYKYILEYYYGSNIVIEKCYESSAGAPYSYPGSELKIGSQGKDIQIIQKQLNTISNNYPSIPKLEEDGIYSNDTMNSVKIFQSIFELPKTGTVDFSTWYEISRVFVSVTKMGEFKYK